MASYLRDLSDEVGSQPNPSRAVSTLSFVDPASSHLGLHPSVMQTLLEGRHANDLDELCVEQVRWILSHPAGSTIDLVLYCTSGRHRSVPTALFLFGAIAKMDIQVATSHMSKAWWTAVLCQRPGRGNKVHGQSSCTACVSEAATDAQNALMERH